MNIDTEIQALLKREGGYVNHPSDRGGPTKYGITLKTLSAWRDVPCTEEDVKKLTKTDAAGIYKYNYYIRPYLYRLPVLLRPLLFDMAVNHGPGNAVTMLQDALLAGGYHVGKIDGIIGNRTVAAADKAAKELGNNLVDTIVNRRIGFYERICKLDETQRVFLPGWIARAESFLTNREQA